MARRSASLAVVLVVLAAACGDGGMDMEALDAGPTTCTLSPDCGIGRWCNPATMMCEQRSSGVNFDRDLFPTIEGVCLACHLPGGVGVKDVNGTGVPLLYTDGPQAVYERLLAGGTTCSGPGAGRVCVNEPQWSLGVIRVIPQEGDGGVSFFMFPDGLHDPWVQAFMRWAAAGARRDPIPDGGVPDAPPPVVYDAPPAPVDAPVVAFDAPPPPPDARVFDAPPPPPDAPVGPDAANPDNVPPTGGDVTAAVSDTCGQVTLTIAAGSDDRTPSDMLRYEVCWGSAPASCSGIGWVTRATFSAAGMQVADVSSRDGTTQHFMGRVVDLSNNHSTPSQTRSAAIPTFLSWSAGNPTVTKTAQPGSYSVTWPQVSSTCPSKAPLEVDATCTGTTCSCVVAGNEQSATCTATTCDAITVSVTASAGRTSATRMRGYTMRFDEVSPVFDVGRGGCRGCHGASFKPTFTTADVGASSAKCTGEVFIKAGDPGDSMIYSVATQHLFLCGGSHSPGTMSAADQSSLRCWIQGGALP